MKSLSSKLRHERRMKTLKKVLQALGNLLSVALVLAGMWIVYVGLWALFS